MVVCLIVCFVLFCCSILSDFGLLFFNPLKKANILQSERGVNSLLITYLRY